MSDAVVEPCSVVLKFRQLVENEDEFLLLDNEAILVGGGFWQVRLQPTRTRRCSSAPTLKGGVEEVRASMSDGGPKWSGQ